MLDRRAIRRAALRVDQHPEHPLYMFTLTGDELFKIANIWHATRDDGGELVGYQRPEAKRHVKNITRYLDGDDVIFPNPIILALSSKASFRRRGGRKEDAGYGSPGVLEIPLPRGRQKKPAWVVDGQQRMMAISKSQRRSELVIPVNAFVTDDVAVQREQFIRVNSSKPLPRGLLTELLPHVEGLLPPNLTARRIPSALCDVLNQDTASPFFGLIYRSSMSKAAKKRTVVKDTSIIRAIEDSLHHPSGSLFAHHNLATGRADIPGIRQELFVYWTAVRDVFPEAWGVPSSESRLMHGAGIRAMGKLMDKVMGNVDAYGPRAAAVVRKEVRKVKSVCAWTDGQWEELGLDWNEVQNTPAHVRRLSDLIVRAYVDR